MAIRFTGIPTQYVEFSGAIPALDLPVRTWAIWFTQNSAVENVPIRISTSGGVNRQAIGLNIPATSGAIRYQVNWSGSTAIWTNNNENDLPMDGLPHLLVISYDGTSSSNDPIFEVDNVNQVLSEPIAPSGNILTGEALIQIGSHPSQFVSTDGIHLSIMYFDHILSRNEKDTIFYSRLNTPINKGLVFSPNLLTNGSIRDRISGVTGNIVGSPIFKEHYYLNLGGI